MLFICFCDDNALKGSVENYQGKHIVCTCLHKKKVPVEDREYLRDQRTKIGPKGSFQLGLVNTAAAKRDQMSLGEADKLQRHIQKKQWEALATFTSTSSKDISLESSSSQSVNSCGDKDEDFKVMMHPRGAYIFLETQRYVIIISANLGESCQYLSP